MGICTGRRTPCVRGPRIYFGKRPRTKREIGKEPKAPVVSNCDLFPGKGGKPLNCFGNNHGGLECINGKYYIFYHRETNRSISSRQGCAEEVRILPDGSIPQAELTSCGLNGGPLRAEGSYSAGIACNLYGKVTPTYSHPMAMMGRHPYITQDAPDYSPESGGQPPRSR